MAQAQVHEHTSIVFSTFPEQRFFSKKKANTSTPPADPMVAAPNMTLNSI